MNYHFICVSVYFESQCKCVFLRSVYLASSLATVSLGQVTKAAECVPDEYESDAIENALNPSRRSTGSINTASRTD